jgi:hypothetical protein
MVLVKDCISYHQGSSPTPIFQTVAALAKGTELLAYEVTLMSAKLRILRAANKALSKRWRAKKNRIRQGGALTIEDAHDILAQKEVDEQIRRDKRSGGVYRNEGKSSARRCGTCGEAGHNARTCQEAIDVSSLSDSK